MPLLLFDNDGTILDGLGPYATSLQKAIQEVFGRQVEIDLKPYHGLTDRKIGFEILKLNEISYTEEEMDNCIQGFGEHYVASASETKVIEGVLDALKILAKRNTIGLVTGNVESMARKKLGLYHLNQYFPFGGFGNEGYDRADLVRNALERAKSHGWDGNMVEVYIIGDTSRDIKAGLDTNIKPIGVTTGKVMREELMDAGAYQVIDSLTELPAILGQ
tara:strand:+ start:207 stop:860 length:654 start_codon:yes stop_codon:yes gene_type:complete